MDFAYIVFGILGGLLLICLIALWVLHIQRKRIKQLHELYMRLLNEEANFLEQHPDKIGEPLFKRYEDLPNFSKMCDKLWIPIAKIEKPLSDYYKQ